MSDKDQDETTVELDIAELKKQLSLPDNTEEGLAELARRNEALNKRFGELLVYMNLIDERVQALSGEGVVSTVLHQHVGQDSTAQVHRSRPATPELSEIRNPQDLDKRGEENPVAKMVVSHT